MLFGSTIEGAYGTTFFSQAHRPNTQAHRVSLKDDGPTGQTTGQRGSDPSAYRVSITGYYNILQGIKPETTQKNLDIIIIKCTPYEIQQQNCNHHSQVKN